MRTGLVALIGQQSDVHNANKACCAGGNFIAQRSGHAATKPAGQDLGAPLALGIDDSTALLAAKSQSFLDNVIARAPAKPAGS
jgi:hypothetical protein